MDELFIQSFIKPFIQLVSHNIICLYVYRLFQNGSILDKVSFQIKIIKEKISALSSLAN